MPIAMEESSNYECSESHQSGGFFAVTKERRALMYAKLDKLREDLKKAVAKREAADAKVKQLEAKLKEEENQQIVSDVASYIYHRNSWHSSYSLQTVEDYRKCSADRFRCPEP